VNEHSPQYTSYLSSKAWKKIRNEMLRLFDYKCQGCGKMKLPSKLYIHHLTYDRLGYERMSDLMVLCEGCHPRFDEIRAREAAAENGAKHWKARLDGWASKVYGEDWGRRDDTAEIEERFEDWLDRRGEYDD